MISKLINPQLKVELTQTVLDELRTFYGCDSVHSGTSIGTLNICFEIHRSGKKLFGKTNPPERQDLRKNIRKQAEVFRQIYGEADIDETQNHTIMITDVFSRLTDILEPAQVRRIISEYQRITIGDIKIPRGDSYPSKAKYFLELLQRDSLLSPKVVNALREHISVFDKTMKDSSVLCHGDLSNNNIMLRCGEPVFIDWEDCFMGPQIYDYAYWLTFFSQRKYYGEITTIFPEFINGGSSIMLCVLLCKCALAHLNGTAVTNKLSAEERICEVLNLV